MGSFFENVIKKGIEYQNYFIEGTKITLLLAFFTVLLGIVIGMFVALMRLSNFKILKFLAAAYTEIIRGTPVMLQVMIIFYALPLIGIKFPDISFIPNFPRFAAGITALSINSGAYVSEVIRSGIQAVDYGQMEAARSIGMKRGMAMRYIVIPQAIRNILPALGNEFITVVKESSIVSIIGIGELIFRTGDVRSITFLTFEPYVIAGIIYFMITFTLSKLLGIAERRMSKGAVR